MQWYINVLKNYVGFSGRARREEFWMYSLINNIVASVLSLLMNVSNIFFIVLLVYTLATFLPSIAVSVRRLHDTNRSGWMLLLALVPIANLALLVFFCQRGEEKENRFGPSPY